MTSHEMAEIVRKIRIVAHELQECTAELFKLEVLGVYPEDVPPTERATYLQKVMGEYNRLLEDKRVLDESYAAEFKNPNNWEDEAKA